MRWKSFGRSGLKVTELSLGTMTLAGQADEATSFAILDAAWDGGIRFLDTADVYPVPMRLGTAGESVAWVLGNPQVTSAIVGASRPEQLGDHLRAVETTLPADLKERLDRVWYELPRRPPDLDSPRIDDWYGVSV